MSNMILGLIIGAAVGYGGATIINGKKTTESDSIKKQLQDLYEENEKLRKRNKETERQIEDLLAQNQKLHRDAKSSGDNQDDLEDELDTANRQVKKLTTQNDELMRKIQEYKVACESYENDISQLKKQCKE